MMWIVTFSDLITLLFTFFVLLLTMCSLEAGKVEQLQVETLGAMGILLEGDRSEVNVSAIEPGEIKVEEELKWEKTVSAQYSALMNWLAREFSQTIVCEETEKGLTIAIMDMLLFSPNTARISPEGGQFLSKLGNFIKDSAVDIVAEGHTDSMPITTKGFPSNWELSIARALSVVRFLAEKAEIEPVRLSAVGYADTKPRAPNDTPENRSRNRRVELVLVAKVL